MTIFTPIFLVVFMTLVVLTLRAIFLVARRRMTEALRALIAPGLITSVYAIVLASVGVLSKSEPIPIGERKCFDDWCFAVKGVKRSASSLEVSVETSNTGRRPQRPDSPQLFAVIDGRMSRLACADLDDRIVGHAQHAFSISVPISETAQKVDFVAVEGGGPSFFIIGDENSPFHSKSAWRLVPSHH